jgi:hypothetical protein
MKKSLYNIEQEYLEIANQLEDGELSPELETALAINERELQGKAIAYAYVIKEAEDDILILETRIKEWQKKLKAKKAIIEVLKKNVGNAMKLYGYHEIKTADVKLNFRRSEGVICTDSSVDIPEEFATVVPQSINPNLNEIKKAIKEGRDVTGFEIEERFSLQIK